MSERLSIAIAVAIALGAVMSPPAQAEGGRPSRQALEAMGLGSLTVMSDAEAQTVRGQGYRGGSYVRVNGNSIASIDIPNGGAMSEDDYFADGKHVAKGSNFSFAGVADIWIGGYGGHHSGPGRDGKPIDNWGGNRPHGSRPGGHIPVKIHATVVFAGGHSSAFAF